MGVLRSIGHDLVDSIASGIGLLIGYYAIDIFEEAQRAPGGVIEVDLLEGEAVLGKPSKGLAKAIALYGEALHELCRKQGVEASAFKKLTARFGVDRVYGRHFTVTIEDLAGRRAVDQYVGSPGRRIRRRISRAI